MSTVVVNVSELQNFEGNAVQELVDFLESKLESKIVSSKKEVTLEFEEGKEATRSCLRLLLKKFLHRAALREDFRVISGGENSFILKEKKVFSE
jgi:hypothetical protein